MQILKIQKNALKIQKNAKMLKMLKMKKNYLFFYCETRNNAKKSRYSKKSNQIYEFIASETVNGQSGKKIKQEVMAPITLRDL